MKPLAIAVLAAAGFTIYWIVTANAGSTTTTITSPLNAIGGLAGQGTLGIDAPGVSATPPPSFTPPAPVTPSISDLQAGVIAQQQGLLQQQRIDAASIDPIGSLLSNP